jgi:UDP:flavonoid glycosyltransferase YjiC (YdhE family)
MKKTIQSGRLTALLKGQTWQQLHGIYAAAIDAAWAVSDGADVLVFKSAIPAGGSVAELRQIPALEANLVPWEPSADLPPLALLGKARGVGPLFNRAGGWLVRMFLWQIMRSSANDFRRAHQLPPLSRRGLPAAHRPPRLPQLIAISPTVLPRPADWGEGIFMTGYWFLSASPNWSPSAALSDFLNRGTPPVCIGFGSMTNDDPQRTLDNIVQAVQQAEVRAIVIGGWAGLNNAHDLPASLLLLDEAPFDWLYPRCVAAVHHGGAGTTATALRAGIPSVIVPHNFDQPFWGKRVERLGAGTAPLPFRQLTAASLTDRLRRVTSDPALRQRAAQLGEQLRSEDGVNKAIRLIETYVVAWQTHRHPHTLAAMARVGDELASSAF